MKVIKSVILTIIICWVDRANCEHSDNIEKVEEDIEDVIADSDITSDVVESRILPGEQL